jgi:nucleotide-binding universal stress UspA family protein
LVSQTVGSFTIVTGYDGSDAARRGLLRATTIAAEPTNLVVVAVTPATASSSVTAEPLVGGDFDAERLLGEAAEQLGQAGITSIECRSGTGDPATVLVDVAREVDADLLIVGRKGSDFVARALLGSVAERVVQQARCDVLVVS